MRDYARVLCAFWTRGSGKALRGQRDAQVLSLYLFSCPAGNMIGLFHLALPTMLHEVGIAPAEAAAALSRLRDLDVAHFDEDHEIVWLPAAPRIQLGAAELHPADKRIPAIAREAAPYRGHPFYDRFIERWGVPLRIGQPLQTGAKAPSKPLPDREGDPGSSGAGAEQAQAPPKRRVTPAPEKKPVADAVTRGKLTALVAELGRKKSAT